ncbi:MAG: phosphatidate cytidylyltransferase [Clostridia bacterium]|nr:phosphatidate cytidylyltransferase [Clostridia bacterium]
MEDSVKKKGKFHFKGERTRSTLIIVAVLAVYVVSIHLNIHWLYTIITALVSAGVTYELVHAVGAESKLLFGVSIAVSAAYVVTVGFHIRLPHPMVLLSFYVMLLLALTVLNHRRIQFIHAAMAFFASICAPYALSCFIRLNDLPYLNGRFTHLEGLFLFWLSFTCSWVTDVFAFLVGRKIGKHKMCPGISPKKSWEGAIFGTLITAAINVLVLLGYTLVATKLMGRTSFWLDTPLKYLYVVPLSVALSVVGMFGDLALSVLKRNVGIKDFSNLLPGHGGIADRFDSCMFVLPTLYGIFSLIYG